MPLKKRLSSQSESGSDSGTSSDDDTGSSYDSSSGGESGSTSSEVSSHAPVVITADSSKFNDLERRYRNGTYLIIVNDVLRCIFGEGIEVLAIRRLNSTVHQFAAFETDKKLIFLPVTEISDMNTPGAIIQIDTNDRVVYACGYATATRYLRALHSMVDPKGPLRRFYLGEKEVEILIAQLKEKCTLLEMNVADDPRLADGIVSVGSVTQRENELSKAQHNGKRRKVVGSCSVIPDSGISEDEESASEMSDFMANSEESIEKASASGEEEVFDVKKADAKFGAFFKMPKKEIEEMNSEQRIALIRRVIDEIKGRMLTWCSDREIECAELQVKYAQGAPKKKPLASPPNLPDSKFVDVMSNVEDIAGIYELFEEDE